MRLSRTPGRSCRCVSLRLIGALHGLGAGHTCGTGRRDGHPVRRHSQRFFRKRLSRVLEPAEQECRHSVGRYSISTRRPHITVLSTGIAAAANHVGFVAPAPGTNFGLTSVNPFPTVSVSSPACPDDSPGNVYDSVVLRIELRVPSGTTGLRFDHNFLTSEYPESRCSSRNDRFIAYLQTSTFSDNVALDAASNPISVDTALFRQCVNGPTGQNGVGGLYTICESTVELIGTGMDVPRPTTVTEQEPDGSRQSRR